MTISLVMRTADGGERHFPVRERVVIGRESRCQVRIALPTVCEQHCELRIVDGELHLTDLESVNGTYHNGRRVTSAVVTDADLLTIGPLTFEVRVKEPKGKEMQASDQKSVTLKPIRDALDCADVPEINVPRRSQAASGTGRAKQVDAGE